MILKRMNDSSGSTTDGIENGSFHEWPVNVLNLFDGNAIETKNGFTASLLAADGNAIRTSLLSVGEMFAPDSRSLLLALWPASRTAKAMTGSGYATLAFVFDRAYFQVHLAIKPLPSTQPLALFRGTIQTGERQKVGYARLKHGIEFDFTPEHAPATLERWRGQIEVLKQYV